MIIKTVKELDMYIEKYLDAFNPIKFNPWHAPAGTPEGGQFTSGEGSAPNAKEILDYAFSKESELHNTNPRSAIAYEGIINQIRRIMSAGFSVEKINSEVEKMLRDMIDPGNTDEGSRTWTAVMSILDKFY